MEAIPINDKITDLPHNHAIIHMNQHLIFLRKEKANNLFFKFTF